MLGLARLGDGCGVHTLQRALQALSGRGRHGRAGAVEDQVTGLFSKSGGQGVWAPDAKYVNVEDTP